MTKRNHVTEARKMGFTDRIRFNWGFHDAQAQAFYKYPRIWTTHFDKAYEAGYWAGMDEYKTTGQRNESSEQAWQQQA